MNPKKPIATFYIGCSVVGDAAMRFKNFTIYCQEKRSVCIDYREVDTLDVSVFGEDCAEHLTNFPPETLLPLAEGGDPEAIVEMGMR